jgi:ribosomal protein S18 acetylase RimI-like enzyme
MIIRAGTAVDIAFLEAMLFEAFYWDPAATRPAFSDFCRDADVAKLLASWGRVGDRALIADDNGTPVGAAWYRLWTPEHQSYGFVDAQAPEVAIAVRAEHRGKGTGRALLMALIASARGDGFPALSLSVNPRNPARGLYESLGFGKVGESGTSWTLYLPLLTVGADPKPHAPRR